ncbi:GNAT domain [Sesbania bispinosa]|nr:GNAT domain [Sesbania bispinosa]
MEELELQVKEENLTANDEAGALTGVAEDTNLEVTSYPEIDNRKVVMELKEDATHDLNARRIKSENRFWMKDIPLDHNSDDPDSKYCKRDHCRADDHVLELCGTDEHEIISDDHTRGSAPIEDFMTFHQSENSERCQNYSSELDIEKELGVDKLELSKTIKETPEDGKRKILERLASDGQKLAILKMALQDLKKKPEKKKKSKKVNEIEYETVKRHIEEVEEAVMQQAGINDQLAKDIEESISSLDRETSIELEKCGGHIQRRRITEEARRVSEQIGRLQFEVQNIQYILLKLADEKNNKGKSRSSRPTAPAPVMEGTSNICSKEESVDLTQISLRPLQLSDLDDVMVWSTDEKVARFCSWEPSTSKDDSINFIESIPTKFLWCKAICLNDRAIGCISLSSYAAHDKLRNKSAELGYVLGSKYWGKGIVTHAVKQVVKAAFSELPHLERLEALVDVENVGSQRVLDKVGFQREGVLRKYVFMKGKSKDMVMFSVLSTVI